MTKWEMQDFSIEFDVAKLMENFFNLRSFSTFGVIHTHHVQRVTVETGIVGAGLRVTVSSVTYPEAFPSGVTPVVIGSMNDTGAAPSNSPAVIVSADNINNTNFRASFYNAHSVATATAFAQFICIDPTYNVSLA